MISLMILRVPGGFLDFGLARCALRLKRCYTYRRRNTIVLIGGLQHEEVGDLYFPVNRGNCVGTI
jgi:hypothetical protein